MANNIPRRLQTDRAAPALKEAFYLGGRGGLVGLSFFLPQGSENYTQRAKAQVRLPVFVHNVNKVFLEGGE